MRLLKVLTGVPAVESRHGRGDGDARLAVRHAVAVARNERHLNKLADVERICLAALEHPASERAAFVLEACHGDEALRQEVESLLAHASPAEQFLAQPALHADDALAGLSGLSIGQRLGAYQIIARLGAGGMGEVYRGRDTRLGRDVAIKILPVVFAPDPERLARFEREARLLASLNHPHIAAIYGIETDAEPDTSARAGAWNWSRVPTLAGPDRAWARCRSTRRWRSRNRSPTRSRPRTRRASSIAISNPPTSRSRPDGTVKVLDFGLAKGEPRRRWQTPSSASPTAHIDGEATGVILGTAAYMCAGAGARRAGGQAHRRLGVRLRALRDADGHARVRRRDRDGHAREIIERGRGCRCAAGHDATGIRRLIRRCLDGRSGTACSTSAMPVPTSPTYVLAIRC